MSKNFGPLRLRFPSGKGKSKKPKSSLEVPRQNNFLDKSQTFKNSLT
jgi:hypothetical protein